MTYISQTERDQVKRADLGDGVHVPTGERGIEEIMGVGCRWVRDLVAELGNRGRECGGERVGIGGGHLWCGVEP